MTTELISTAEAVIDYAKSLHIPRHRAPYDSFARMEDIIRKNATKVPGRHAAEVTS